jgi:hypothetical protein
MSNLIMITIAHGTIVDTLSEPSGIQITGIPVRRSRDAYSSRGAMPVETAAPSALVLSVSPPSRCTPSEHHGADHYAGDPNHSRQLSEDRERQEEREHDQYCAYTDQDSGHGITVHVGVGKCPLPLR